MTGGRHHGTRTRLDHKVAELGLLAADHLAPDGAWVEPVTEADLDTLPDAARRWLVRCGVVGRPRVRSFRVRFAGEMRMKPDQGWMPLEAWQVNTVAPVARVFQMRIDAAHVVPMIGTDSYVDHVGSMRGRVFGLIPVAEGAGPEFDLGELVTWVNDAVMLAPSMLLTPATVWEPIDDHRFALTVTDDAPDRTNVVRAEVVLDDHDRPADFVTDDRWYAGTDPPTRTRWHTPFTDWTTTPDGQPIPGRGEAVWSFDDGDFAYIRGEFDPTTLELDLTS